jgi:gamma-tubulin complex component 3
MSSRSNRINNGIEGLVRRLLVEIPGEDAASADEREQAAIDFVKEVLERYMKLLYFTLVSNNGASSSKSPAIVADVNQASDLIKKRLIQTNSSPEKALRFTNLYSRLLSIPVISQKWAVLYFLYQLGAQPQPVQSIQPTLTSPFKSPTKNRRGRILKDEQVSDSPKYGSKREESPIQEAFAPEGLKRLPTREGGQRERRRG